MPGVAFDDAGGRMGRGKGYYDRYLDRVKDFHAKKNKPMPTLIALAFDEQIVDEVPRSPTDRITDLVLHAKRIQESQSSA